MATALYRLGRTAYRRWPLFIAGWLVLLLGVGAFSASQSKPFSESFSLPGIPSMQAADLQKELFPGGVSADKQVTGEVVVQAPAGHTLAEQPYKGQLDILAAQLQKMPQLGKGEKLANPVVAGPAVEQQLVAAAAKNHTPKAAAQANAKVVSPLSADKRTGIISWNFAASTAPDVTTDTQNYVKRVVADARANGMTAVAAGTGMSAFEMGHTSELVGIGFALVILLVTFGSLVAAGLPIVSALVGVGLGSLLVTSATHFWDLNSNTPVLATMIGLAVGIDYALFILSRYRAEYRRTGDREEAIGVAIGTAGSAVVFAGLTVVIALSALYLSGVSVLGSMGLAAAVTVVLAVLVAITFLPAVLGLLKGKAFAGRVRRETAVSETDHHAVNGSVRLGRFIAKAPLAIIAVVVVAFVALAKPVTDLHLGLPSDATAAKSTDARTAADLVADGWGPGRNAPTIAIVDNRSITAPADRQKALGTVTRWLAADSNVANAQVVQATQDLTGAVVLVTPKTGPADTATDDLLDRLRNGQGAIESSSHAHVGITGITAIGADFSTKLRNALPLYLAIVVGLAFVILVLVFRSLVVPLVATAGFLLSVLTTLGATVRLVQYGDLGIFDPQPVMSLMPTLLIGIVFGLAMDYQVFLTTRMREAYVHGMEPRDAIVDGFRHSGRVVTAAALIMMSVFAAFAAQDNALIKSMGVALALAIFLDAFVVRMVLVPAVMNVLGRHAWWMPRWLDRILPNVDVEGATLHRDAPATMVAGEPVATSALPSEGTTPDAASGVTVAAAPALEPAPAVESTPTAMGRTTLPTPGVHGAVSDAGGLPVRGARVTVTDRTGRELGRTTTGSDGGYELALPATGRYLVIVAADGVAPSAAQVDATGGAVRHDTTLRGSGSLTGRVTRLAADVHEPVDSATVVVSGPSGDVAATTSTDADGRYAVSGLGTGSHVVIVRAQGRGPVAHPVSVAGHAVHDIALPAGAVVTGVVHVAADGRPVPGATVTVTDSAGVVVASTTSDTDGGYRFDDVPCGEHVLAAHLTAEQTVTTSEGRTEETMLALGEPAPVRSGRQS